MALRPVKHCLQGGIQAHGFAARKSIKSSNIILVGAHQHRNILHHRFGYHISETAPCSLVPAKFIDDEQVGTVEPRCS